MTKDTVCRLCSACCPIQAEIKDGRLVMAERKSSLPQGQVLHCPKLKAAPEIVYAPDRITAPLIRNAPSERNEFREASWDEALNLVASKFGQVKKEYGAHQVAWLRGMAADWGAPWDYANRLMNAYGSPNCIGNGSVCHVAREMAHNFTYGAMTLPQPKEAKCLVVWGKNDRNTAPGTFEALLQARENGAGLIVIDPVKTVPAEMADIWLQIRPGQDGILAMAMIREIIENELYDAPFVQDHCLGFSSLQQAAQAYVPEQVAPGLWLDADKIKEAARMYARSKPACIIDGNGLDMQRDTFQATRAVCILRALTGNLDRPGGDFIPQPVPARDIQLKDRLPPDVQPVTMDYPLFSTFHHNWGLHAQSALVDAILEEEPYPMKMMVVQSGNPAVTMTDSHRVQQALDKLDFLVVIDLFMTRTAKMADVFLPAASCFEKTQLNRAALRNSPVILQNQVIDWVGQSWPDWKITFELGRRLGLDKEFPWDTAEQAIDYQLHPSGITVQMLRDNPSGVRADDLEYRKYRTQGFATPSGKVELFSQRLADSGYAPVPHQDGKKEVKISFAHDPKRFDLVGISGQRVNRFTHTQFHTIPSLIQNQTQGFVHMHTRDAQARGIEHEDMVRVETPRGRLRMPVSLSNTMHPGSVCIDWGWGDVHPEANVNNLTDDDQRDPVTATPSNRSFMCAVRKDE
ncbi:MAG: molybdopterin-dependent oxidoreductase [Desulfovermiculus sp.]